MSIENIIQDLTAALNNNTAAILAANGSVASSPTVKAPTAKASDTETAKPEATKRRTTKAKVVEPEPAATPEYTLDEVRELSSSLLTAEAIDKDVLKAKIIELGFNKMADMDDAGLAALYEFMLEIYTDAQAQDGDAADEL